MKSRGRGRKSVNDDMKLLGLQLEWVIFRDMWKDFILGKRLTIAKCLTIAKRGKNRGLNKNDDDTL